MSCEGLVYKERAFYTLMLQEQNEYKQAQLYISILWREGGSHMTGAQGSWTIMVQDRGRNGGLKGDYHAIEVQLSFCRQ